MTLDNLKYALILNNKMLLDRMKSFMHQHNNLAILNGLTASAEGKLAFNGALVSEQEVITDEEIKAMVDQVIAELDKNPGTGGTTDPSNPDEVPTELYCYKKNISDSNPDTRIEYAEDNASFIPVKMNFETGTFGYGSWSNAFFMKIRPVMLNYNGTVAYELDSSNYSKKKDGTNSDIANVNFAGNAMIGIPTIWFKRETVNGYEYVYVSNKKIDNTYKAYAHTDENGNIMKYTYIPIYNGSIDASGKLRSISGVAPTCSTTMDQEIIAAELNNPSGKHMWNIETRADVQMLMDLCTLISKTSNSQTAFGTGNITGGETNVKATGTMNDKGLFYGTNAGNDGVKVFGIEHFWGNRWGRTVGSVYVNNVMKVKMTYGTQDGSTATGYNQDGSGYITVNDSAISGTNGGYISKTFNNDYGRFVKEVSGSENTYDCDGCWFADGVMPELHGGDCNDGVLCGCGYVAVHIAASASHWYIGASCSCKPNVAENILISAT